MKETRENKHKIVSGHCQTPKPALPLSAHPPLAAGTLYNQIFACAAERNDQAAAMYLGNSL